MSHNSQSPCVLVQASWIVHFDPFISADKRYYKYKMIVHQYEKSYKGDSELDDYFRFKMASSANLRKSQDGISNLG